MKLSDVTIANLKNYSHVYHDEDNALFEAVLIACKKYIQAYTGLSAEALDLHEDLTIALYVLANEMYDNRNYSIDGAQVNKVVQSILDIHSINLL
jgi:N12 class adenine-specific DNA methylase